MPASANKRHELRPISYADGGSIEGGGRGQGATPVKPPANRNRPRRKQGPKRVVVFDRSSARYMSVILETQGIESHFARNADEFLKLVHNHNPHLAFAHIQEIDAVLMLKRDPVVGATPTVVVNSAGPWGAKTMAEAGLAGPMIDLPYNAAYLTAAIECFGRSGDQPFPEPVPYLVGDPSLLDAPSTPTNSAQRCFLIVADGFGLIYLTRTLNGLGRIVHARSRSDAHAAMALKDLDLLIVLDPSGYTVSELDRSARAVGIPMIALVHGDRIERANEIKEGEASRHLWPISKGRLVDLVEATLTRFS